MIVRLPILLKLKENIYTEVELKKPSGEVLANTQEALQKNAFVAMTKFVSGCVIKIISENNEITDNIQIMGALNKMSNKNLEFLSKEIMVWYYNGADKIEGVYYCPRCNNKSIAERTKTEDGIEIDTRDSLGDLEINYMKEPSNLEFEILFEEPLIVGKGETEDFVTSIHMRFPAMEDYIKAHASIPENKSVIFQYAVYARAITKVNGNAVNDFYTTGVKMFKAMREGLKETMDKIAECINKYGMDNRVEKYCNNCGKVWRPYVNTLNFFDFALQ